MVSTPELFLSPCCFQGWWCSARITKSEQTLRIHYKRIVGRYQTQLCLGICIWRSDSWPSRWQFLSWCQVACPLPRSYCISGTLSRNSCFWMRREMSQLFPMEADGTSCGMRVSFPGLFQMFGRFSMLLLVALSLLTFRARRCILPLPHARVCSHVWGVKFVLHLLWQTSREYYSLPSNNYTVLDCQLISQAIVGSCLQGQITIVIWPSLENQGFRNLQVLLSLGFSLDFF